MILRAYRVELDPNNVQRTAMQRHAGAVRFIYNWGLAAITQSYQERKAATPEGERVKGAINPIGLMAQLPALKGTHPWLAEVTAQALQASLRNLDKAFQGFFRRVKAGQTPGYPKFKKRGASRNSFQFPPNHWYLHHPHPAPQDWVCEAQTTGLRARGVAPQNRHRE